MNNRLSRYAGIALLALPNLLTALGGGPTPPPTAAAPTLSPAPSASPSIVTAFTPTRAFRPTVHPCRIAPWPI